MKTNLRSLLLCAALAGFLPLMLAAQTATPAATDKDSTAVSAPAVSASSTTSAESTAGTSAATASTSTTAPEATASTTAAPAAGSSSATESKSEPPLRRLDSTAAAPEAPSEPAAEVAPEAPRPQPRARRHSGQNERVVFAGNSVLGKDESADTVVAIAGNATNEGEVRDSVVAVAGNARTTGPVGDSVVAVFGNAYVDAPVGEVVAVLGNVELGPKAEVRGDVVSVGGQVKRDPKSVVHGNIPNVVFPVVGVHAEWLQTYLAECVLKGRPLAIDARLAWAWYIAIGLLLLYVAIGLIFGGGVDKTMRTLETRPGGSILAAVLTLLLTPVLIVLLCVTVVGIAVVPFLAIFLMCATLFGKAVMLAWLGRRITRNFGEGPLAHPAFAILIGGVIVLALYIIPVVGFIVYKLLGILGLGVVVYTLLLASKREKRAPAFAGAPAAVPVGTSGVADPAMAGFAAEGAVSGAAVPLVVPVPVAVATLPRAGFWIRLGAMLLDVILCGILLAVINSVLPHRAELTMPGGLLLLLAIYAGVMWKFRGTTIGGIICGLRVVRTDGREIDWATAFVRALGCFLSLVVVGLGFIWVAIDDERQSWHDKIAGTAVVLSRGTTLV